MPVYFFTILLFWVIFSLAGILFTHPWRTLFPISRCLGIFFWLGWLGTIFFLQAWHLFFPVNLSAFSLLLITALAGWLFYHKAITAVILKYYRSIFIALIIIFLLMLPALTWVWVAPLDYDSRLYHIQAIKWALNHPLVPGLANLHDRLAYSFSYFLYPALLDTIHPQMHHLANSLLLFAFLIQAAYSTLRLLHRSKENIYGDFLTIAFTLPILYLFFPTMISSPSPNTSVGLLEILATIALANQTWPLAIIYAAGLAIFKINALAFALIVLLIMTCHYCTLRTWRNLIKLWVFFLSISGLSAIRNIVLSGYPFYPLSWFPAPVEWRLPLACPQRALLWIKAFARQPIDQPISYQLIYSYAWLKSWLSEFFRHFQQVQIPFACGITGTLALIMRRCLYGLHGLRLVIPFIPALITLVIWFITAPSLRFAEALLIICGIGPLAAALYQIYLTGPVKLLKPLAITGMIAAFIAFYPFIFLTTLAHQPGLNPLPSIQASSKTLSDGSLIYVPQESDRCNEYSLPCAPYAHPALKRRNTLNLSRGFMVSPRDENDPTVGASPHQK